MGNDRHHNHYGLFHRFVRSIGYSFVKIKDTSMKKIG